MTTRQLLVAILLCACSARPVEPAPPVDGKEDIAPEADTGYQPREEVAGGQIMAVAANPHASRAGFEVLKEGGSAADAAVAMAVVLTLVEPQSSGIGGGAFLLHYDASDKRVRAFDGRETAPALATPDMFLAGNAPMGFYDAVVGGLSVGVPGELRMLELVHRQHGKLPWKRLLEPAIRLAEEGFEISPRLHALLADAPALETMKVAGPYFYRDGAPKPVGERLVNPALAAVLRRVAEHGADAFYRGPIAAEIAAAAKDAERNPGRLRAGDLAAYRAIEREPVCLRYRRHRLCGMPPPSSGGVTTLQILGMLERFDLGAHPPDGLHTVHLFAEAGRLAYADRERYIADPDRSPLPFASLLDPGYLAERSRLINPERAMGVASPGEPPGMRLGDLGDDRSLELPSTSHLVVVDAAGDAVSMTASIESAFGSHVMVHGFLLNNELTDFSFLPEHQGRPVLNRVEPGKRPRSSMAPFIVLDDQDDLVLTLGSPGGSRIINYVARVLITVIDHDLGPQEAIAQPNYGNRNGPTEIESSPAFGDWAAEMERGLKARGHEVKVVPLNSGLHAIRRQNGRYLGGADPRREGLVLSQ
jgi:gamma-glutamyltranspeptidase / glutathione hydrolase